MKIINRNNLSKYIITTDNILGSYTKCFKNNKLVGFLKSVNLITFETMNMFGNKGTVDKIIIERVKK